MHDVSGVGLVLLPLPGTEWMAEKIKNYISDINPNITSEIAQVEIIRFSSGDAKAMLMDSVRGKDVFILVDVRNCDCNNDVCSRERHLSPDEHFQNLIRTISAIGGKAFRINVIMPLLYASRQDRKSYRESLDCAIALQFLEKLGVKNIVTLDVHDDRVQNAVPLLGFDNLTPIYQTIKAMCKHYSDIRFDSKSMVLISPDLGGANRVYMYASPLSIDFGLFYKRRDHSIIVNGSNPIVEHKYIGPELDCKDVLIIDDIIDSGKSILEAAAQVKSLGAKRVFVGVTFCNFSNGIHSFNEAYSKGIFDALFISNASYCNREVVEAPWYREVNVVKYISLYVYSVSSGISLANILDPKKKITDLLGKYNLKHAD